MEGCDDVGVGGGSLLTVRVTACWHSLQLAVCSTKLVPGSRNQLMGRFNDLRGSHAGAGLV